MDYDEYLKKMKLSQRLALKPYWAAQKMSSGNMLLSSEADTRLVQGEVFERVLSLLNGQRTQDEIVRALRGAVTAQDVRAAIRSLESEGLLAEPGSGVSGEDAFWSLLGTAPAEVAARRGAACVEVLATAGANAEAVVRALVSLDIQVQPGAALRVAVADDYLNAGLEQLNQDSWQRGQAWTIVKPYGRRVWLGPLFVPGRTACWSCMAERLRLNGCTAGASITSLRTTTETAALLMATEIAKWLLTGKNSELEGQILTLDMGSLDVQRHAVTARPQCPVCGSQRKKKRSPAPAKSSGLRVNTSDATVAWLREQVSPLTGIVARLEKAGSWPGFCIYTAMGSQVWRPDFRGNLLLSNRMAVSGAGRTDAEAQASCLGEAMERYSLQFHGDEPRTNASYREIAKDALDPLALLQFSAAQYRRRKSLNRRWAGMDRVPELFDPNQPVEWTAVQSLTTGKKRFVPTAYCYLGYGERFCDADTNGCAAGSVWQEAVLHGLLELVERDAVGLWWYTRARRPAFAWETLGSSRVRSLIDLIRERGRIVHLLDVTTDLAIPSFAAVSSRLDGSAMLAGTGAGLDPESAIWNAVAELTKILLYREVARSKRTASVPPTRSFLLPSRAPRKTLQDYRGIAAPDLKSALQACIDRLTARGFEIYTLNATRPEIGFPVARVIVPGLRHWRPRFAAGRLYDAPAAMSWGPRKLKESELNPAPFFP